MLTITNGRVFYKGEFIETDVAVENGRIVRVGAVHDADETLDAHGQWLLPGLIDPHVHLREPGAIQKEDFYTGSRAALAGGFTSVMDMPNNNPPTTTHAAFREKQHLSRKALCEIYFHFGVTTDNLSQIRRTAPGSLKVYLSETTGAMHISLADAARHFEQFDPEKPIVVHAEGNAIRHTIELARKTNRRIHIAHAPTAKAIILAKTYPKSTVEVTPHHLFLSDTYAKNNPELGQVKPPLQPDTTRAQLWSVIDRVDCIATDHAPHTLEEKEQGAYGFPGLETSFGLMLEAYRQRDVSFPWLMQRMSENPARIFGLSGRGNLEKGHVANLILFDPKKEWVVRGEDLETKCRWSPFEGRKLKGKTTMAMVQGKVVYEEGEFF